MDAARSPWRDVAVRCVRSSALLRLVGAATGEDPRLWSVVTWRPTWSHFAAVAVRDATGVRRAVRGPARRPASVSS
jgi:hypothetical protein